MKKFKNPEVKVIGLTPSDIICSVLLSAESSKLTVFEDTSGVVQNQYKDWKAKN